MKKKAIYPIFLVVMILLAACSGERPEKKRILARVNDYELTLSEFEAKLVENMAPDEEFRLTLEMKKKFLDELVRKEILIQEARRLKLDRKDKFIRAMEKYWEQTLIRDLYDAKSDSLSKEGYVSSEEIERFYNEKKKSNADIPPLEEVREIIAGELKEQKNREKLMEWERTLQEKADISIEHEMLSKNW
ncbi:MAG: hypothetical protein GY859_19040 [Desulfobacterales bacterium]|nr:hypothetical protein [Desulfobacterales bacterium]